MAPPNRSPGGVDRRNIGREICGVTREHQGSGFSAVVCAVVRGVRID